MSKVLEIVSAEACAIERANATAVAAAILVLVILNLQLKRTARGHPAAASAAISFDFMTVTPLDEPPQPPPSVAFHKTTGQLRFTNMVNEQPATPQRGSSGHKSRLVGNRWLLQTTRMLIAPLASGALLPPRHQPRRPHCRPNNIWAITIATSPLKAPILV